MLFRSQLSAVFLLSTLKTWRVDVFRNNWRGCERWGLQRADSWPYYLVVPPVARIPGRWRGAQPTCLSCRSRLGSRRSRTTACTPVSMLAAMSPSRARRRSVRAAVRILGRLPPLPHNYISVIVRSTILFFFLPPPHPLGRSFLPCSYLIQH